MRKIYFCNKDKRIHHCFISSHVNQKVKKKIHVFDQLKVKCQLKNTYIVFLVFFLFSSRCPSAQTFLKGSDSISVAMLYDSLLNLRIGNDYDAKELRQEYEKAVPKFVETFGEQDHRTIYSYSILGFLHRDLGDFQSAKKIIGRGVKIIESSERKPNAAQIYYSAADLAVGMGEYDRTIKYCEKGLNYASNPSLQRGQLLNILGIAYMEMHDNRKAVEYFEDYIGNSKRREDQSDDIKREIAFAYGNIAICFAQIGDLDLAKEKFEQSLSFFKQTKSHGHVVSVLRNLALVCNLQEDIEDELNYLLQAKEVQLKHITEAHPEMVAIYTGLGGLQLSKQDFKAALSYFEKGLNVAKKVYKTGVHVEQVKMQIANTNRLMGKKQEAINSYLSVISFYQNGGSQYLMPLSVCYYVLGLSYNEIGDYDEAKKYLQKSLSIKKELREEDHQELGELYLAIAENELVRNNIEKAYPLIWVQSGFVPPLLINKFVIHHNLPSTR